MIEELSFAASANLAPSIDDVLRQILERTGYTQDARSGQTIPRRNRDSANIDELVNAAAEASETRRER